MSLWHNDLVRHDTFMNMIYLQTFSLQQSNKSNAAKYGTCSGQVISICDIILFLIGKKVHLMPFSVCDTWF